MATQNYHSIKNAALITPATATDLGSVAQPYGNLYLQGNVTLGSTTITATSSIVPKITSLSYPGSATAADPAGGQTITINGTGFLSGISAYIANTVLGATNLVSSTQVTFTAPAKTAGSYTLSVTNTDGGSASYVGGISYSALPVWSTSAGSLGTADSGTTISTITLAATENAQTITYAVTSGTLPSGLTLNSNGNITGTLSGSATTYNFTVTATDPQGQTASRNFSYAVNVAPATSSIDYLVVAGGGAGGTCSDTHQYGAGGGAGGLLTGTISSGITNGTSFTITVGAGGTVSAVKLGGGAGGTNGGDSSLVKSGTNIYCYGGGAGGTKLAGGQQGADGGSGGGTGRYGGGSGGRGVYPGSGYISGPRQGYDGYGEIGGGGGAGGAGGNGSGGAAYSSSITGSAVNYGKGGGVSAYVATRAALSGSPNTGDAGEGGQDDPYNVGGTGGSGVVIIRYANTSPDAASTTGLAAGYPQNTGGYKIYKWITSGSITF
jgi:hypothetical protein